MRFYYAKIPWIERNFVEISTVRQPINHILKFWIWSTYLSTYNRKLYLLLSKYLLSIFTLFIVYVNRVCLNFFNFPTVVSSSQISITFKYLVRNFSFQGDCNGFYIHGMESITSILDLLSHSELLIAEFLWKFMCTRAHKIFPLYIFLWATYVLFHSLK